jgi:hypothetical protein
MIDDGNVFFARKVSSKFLGRRKISPGSVGRREGKRGSCLGKGTHVGGFEPPIPDRLKPELHRFLVPQTPEPLGVNVALVHEHVALFVVPRDEACARKGGNEKETR